MTWNYGIRPVEDDGDDTIGWFMSTYHPEAQPVCQPDVKDRCRCETAEIEDEYERDYRHKQAVRRQGESIACCWIEITY
jgi:hypothetical protein